MDEVVGGNVPKKKVFEREGTERERGDGPQGRCPVPSKEWGQPQSLCWSHLGLVPHISPFKARR